MQGGLLKAWLEGRMPVEWNREDWSRGWGRAEGLALLFMCPSGKGRGVQKRSRGLLARLLEAAVKRSPAR